MVKVLPSRSNIPARHGADGMISEGGGGDRGPVVYTR
jgi:hypothetical protein